MEAIVGLLTYELTTNIVREISDIEFYLHFHILAASLEMIRKLLE